MRFERPSVEAAERLAQLLSSNEHGAEILATMQQFGAPPAIDGSVGSTGAGGNGSRIGVWDIERTGDGVALRRAQGVLDWFMWANIEQVPAQGDARRVVLVGESAARGWLLDPVFNPAGVLQAHLDAAEPGAYQCVDLARNGADLDDLGAIIECLPSIEPDLVVLFAGNNFTFAPLDDSYRDLLADALRAGGYSAMWRCFNDDVVRPRVERLLSRIAELRRQHGIETVIVVPETNLSGWRPTPNIEVPVLPHDSLLTWHLLRHDAYAATESGAWSRVEQLAEQMSLLDEGMSPVSWYLRGRAAQARADGAAARAAFQAGRDVAAGLLLDHAPTIVSWVQDAEREFAARHGLPCVDVAAVLASTDIPELPDERAFIDNCHLSDVGIATVMSHVADAVLGLEPGTTRPSAGAPADARAIAHALGAASCAFRHQSADVVRHQLDAAVDADADTAKRFLNTFVDLLEHQGPKWIRPDLAGLIAIPQAALPCMQFPGMRGHTEGFWTLRHVVQEQLDREPDRTGWATTDLLATGDPRGFRTPSHAPGKAYFEATKKKSVFAFAVGQPESKSLRLTYRIPANAWEVPAQLTVNESPVAQLPHTTKWSTVVVTIPREVCRPGVNWVEIEWPVPDVDDGAQLAADVSALTQRLFPTVLPTFGAVFAAVLETAGATEQPGRAVASRVDTSSGWLGIEQVIASST